MKYCRHCGAPMEDTDSFCSQCGVRAICSTTFPCPPQQPPKPEPLNKLSCELAYLGTLFWVPLLLTPKAPHAKRCANHGLWILILSTLACTGIRFLGAINEWSSGTLPGVIFGGIYSLAFLLFLCFMLYLLWLGTSNALAIHRGVSPDAILFFDQIPLIHEEA